MKEKIWDIVFQGNLIAVERLRGKGYERAVRPPGVRLILKNDEEKILLTKEFRMELDAYDYRLPGGKVFDDLESYLEVRGDDKRLEESVIQASKLEAKEEAGIEEIENLKITHISKAGATIEWTLYYVEGDIVIMSGKQNLHGEELVYGIEVGFYTSNEIQSMIGEGKIKEERSVAVLMKNLS